MTNEELRAIELVTEGAEIAGPWETWNLIPDGPLAMFTEQHNVYPTGDECGPICAVAGEARAKFIAASSAAVPALCAALRERDMELAVVTAEREEARDWVRRITATKITLTCVYCGVDFPPGTPNHGADVLTVHVRACAKHPMRAAETELAALRAAVAKFGRLTLSHSEDCGHRDCNDPETCSDGSDVAGGDCYAPGKKCDCYVADVDALVALARGTTTATKEED
jgi:hypothetical protein